MPRYKRAKLLRHGAKISGSEKTLMPAGPRKTAGYLLQSNIRA